MGKFDWNWILHTGRHGAHLIIYAVTSHTCMVGVSKDSLSSRQARSRQKYKSISICLILMHHVNIAVYLERIHSYLCAVKFKDPYSIKEVMPMCPIAHVPHAPRCPTSICSIKQNTCSEYVICTPLPMCPIPVPHLDICIAKQQACSGYMSHVPLDPHLDPLPVMR